MQASATPKGTIIQGEYVLLEPIGEAGSTVYRAHHMASGRLVAIRLWRGELSGAAEAALEQVQIASRVRHPALAAVEAHGRQTDGTTFIVSEYVDGDPLDRWADRTGIPPLATVVELVHRLCVGLNAAHRNGLTHDALHPRNVRVKQSDAGPASRIEVRLLDLGVPAFMHPWPPRMHAAQFMAPEQLARALRATGAAPVHADGRMNVYSCGCILYYLCTGGAPFQDRNLHDLTLSHAAGKLVLPSKINPQIPPALDAIIARSLAFVPEERYPSVSELALALARVQLSRTSSGVRPVVIAPPAPPAPPAAAEPDKRSTWNTGFEERPTSESRVPLLLSLSERRSSVPPAHAMADPPVPKGSFSSAPPPDVPTVPPPPRPSAAPPALPVGAIAPRVPPPPPRAPRLEPQPISALLEPAADLRQVEPAPIAPSTPAVRRSELATHAPRPARARRMPRTATRASWALALLACAGIGYWLLGREPLPAEQVRTTPLPAVESTPRAPERSSAMSQRAPALDLAAPAREADQTAAADVANAPAQPTAALQPARAGRVRPFGAPRGNARAPAVHGGAPALAPEPQLAVRPIGEAAAPPDGEPQRSPDAAPREDAPVLAAEPPAGDALQPAAQEPTNEAAPTRPATGESVARLSAASAAGEGRGGTVDAVRSGRLLEATARIGDLTVRGSLTTSEVRRAVERIRAQLAACYARAARSAGRNGYGALQVEVEIDERGRARTPRAVGGSLPGLDACVAQAAGKVVSSRPPDTGTVRASWKVAFSP